MAAVSDLVEILTRIVERNRAQQFAQELVSHRILPVSRGRSVAQLTADHAASVLIAILTQGTGRQAVEGFKLFASLTDGGQNLHEAVAAIIESGYAGAPAPDGELCINRSRRIAMIQQPGQPDRVFSLENLSQPARHGLEIVAALPLWRVHEIGQRMALADNPAHISAAWADDDS